MDLLRLELLVGGLLQFPALYLGECPAFSYNVFNRISIVW